ncbi:rod-binding protein [Pseudooceanicola nanhaiensis]|uniref:rod-binding protein n=1 Tax=Pseudooceanicola nanhaiensis TaxID=375761 RepID=UPI001CD6686D|nr:rod-binding protein [Pseudooceanicola nanhaiensis]MCA0920383.1 rod-binding protein [Pseudooceanicola nanhaiensis]
MPDPLPAVGPLPLPPSPDVRLRTVARDLEAAFLSEMLGAAGLGEVPGAFGGGTGEAQFASFLRDEQARALASAGGIGLAEALFNTLKEREIHGN